MPFALSLRRSWRMAVAFGFAFAIAAPISAQDKQEKVALLKHQINLANEDTAKVKLLLELGSQYTFVLSDSLILYTEQAIELLREPGAGIHQALHASIPLRGQSSIRLQ